MDPARVIWMKNAVVADVLPRRRQFATDIGKYRSRLESLYE
jgi:hypothetical protein